MPEEQTEKFEYDFSRCKTVVTGEWEASDVIAALQKTMGNYSAMGRLLQKSRSAVKSYVEKNQELVLLRVDLREGLLDEVEDSTFDTAIAGDGVNGRFLLTTLGKDRGYTTKTEINGKFDVDPSLRALLDRIAENGRRLGNAEQEQKAT